MSPGRRLRLGLTLIGLGLARLALTPLYLVNLLLLVLSWTLQELLESAFDWLQARSSTCSAALGSPRSRGSAARD